MLDPVDRLYIVSDTCSVELRPVICQPAREFSIAVRRLQRAAYETAEHDLWNPLLRLLKGYRFRSASVPLPLNHPALISQPLLNKIRQAHSLASYAGGTQTVAAAGAAMSCLESLARSGSNPLGDRFYEIARALPASASAAAIILENSLIPDCRKAFSYGLAHYVIFLSPFELRRTVCFDRLFVFGSPRWYSDKGLEFVFHAPRAPLIDVIAFRWLNNSFGEQAAFPGTQPPFVRPGRGTGIRFHQPAEPDPDPEENPFDILPQINVDSIRRILRQQAPVGPDADEEAEARLVLLSGNRGVFLEISDSASSYVIDLSAREQTGAEDTNGADETADDTDTDTLFGRKLNIDLEPGTFLLLRTEGGGDLVQQLADTHLAATPGYAHSLQLHWKKLLAEAIRDNGVEWILHKLEISGGNRVTWQTVRNWKSTRHIRPDSPNFEALLQVLGLEADRDRIIGNTVFIRRARLRAGMQIRRLLLAQIKKADLSRLAQEGSMTFHLDNKESGGSMTAFRIEKILPDIHVLPYNQIDHPIELTEDLWH